MRMDHGPHEVRRGDEEFRVGELPQSDPGATALLGRDRPVAYLLQRPRYPGREWDDEEVIARLIQVFVLGPRLVLAVAGLGRLGRTSAARPLRQPPRATSARGSHAIPAWLRYSCIASSIGSARPTQSPGLPTRKVSGSIGLQWPEGRLVLLGLVSQISDPLLIFSGLSPVAFVRLSTGNTHSVTSRKKSVSLLYSLNAPNRASTELAGLLPIEPVNGDHPP